MEGKLLWGLVGNSKISQHSVAPKMWKALFYAKNMPVEYFILEGDNESKMKIVLKDKLRDEKFVGCNVALPWKNLGFEFCNSAEESVKITSTANTLIRNKEQIKGYNSDGEGIVNAIKNIINIQNKTVLILGSGSSAQTMPYHLAREDVRAVYVSDIVDSKADELEKKYLNFNKDGSTIVTRVSQEKIDSIIPKVDILINATPCGMEGFKKKFPFNKEDFCGLDKKCLCVEAIYNPYETPFLKYAKNKGCKICPGVNMLVEQAAISFFYGFKRSLSDKDKKVMEKAAMEELQKI